MKKLIEKVKSWNLNRIFIIFLAGSLLVLSTACGQGRVASNSTGVEKSLAKNYDTNQVSQNRRDVFPDDERDVQFKAQTTQVPQGGMNLFNDDPRYDNPNVQAKSKSLVEQSKFRDEKYDSLGDYVSNVTDNAAKNLEQTREDLTQGAKLRGRVLQRNLDTATDNAKNATEGLKDNLPDLT
ncbi:hypothetical protein STA3757_02230 [Stanieria sp. NIES-3757]|nr:hypothetical protein STA3757_02230 [Stanieria sp. NIES-3757]